MEYMTPQLALIGHASGVVLGQPNPIVDLEVNPREDTGAAFEAEW